MSQLLSRANVSLPSLQWNNFSLEFSGVRFGHVGVGSIINDLLSIQDQENGLQLNQFK